MAMVLINETPTEVGSGADEIIRLRAENAALKAERDELERMLICVETNLSKTMSKSIQKLQAKTIREVLCAMKGEA